MKKVIYKEGKKGKKIKKTVTYFQKKDICHVKDLDAYVQHVIKERGLDPKTTLIRVGLDGGGGSLKVLISVFDPLKAGDAPEDWRDLLNGLNLNSE